MKLRRMVVVTGMSGSGRSAALKAFEDMGYYCCKSGGSLGAWDVVAVSKKRDNDKWPVRLIQVKSNRPPGKTEMDTLTRFAVHYAVQKELWIYHDRKGWEVRVL